MVSLFENITVNKAANVYFDGKVTSRAITFTDGSTKTLGIMLPGQYQFSTEKAELMEITSGKAKVTLLNSEQTIEVTSGESFDVPANASFVIEVFELLDYCCSFIDE